MIKGPLLPTSRPPFSTTADPEKRADGGRHPPEAGLSAGAGSSKFHGCWADLIWEQVGFLSEGGLTLIKVKSLKSDFDRRDPAGHFSAAFLRNRGSAKKGRRGRTPSKMRAIRRCRKQGKLLLLGRLNSPSSWGPGALSEEILEVRL